MVCQIVLVYVYITTIFYSRSLHPGVGLYSRNHKFLMYSAISDNLYGHTFYYLFYLKIIYLFIFLNCHKILPEMSVVRSYGPRH